MKWNRAGESNVDSTSCIFCNAGIIGRVKFARVSAASLASCTLRLGYAPGANERQSARILLKFLRGINSPALWQSEPKLACGLHRN